MVTTFKPLAAYPTSQRASKYPMTLDCESNSPMVMKNPLFAYFFLAGFFAAGFTLAACSNRRSLAHVEVGFPAADAAASRAARSSGVCRIIKRPSLAVSEIGFRPISAHSKIFREHDIDELNLPCVQYRQSRRDVQREKTRPQMLRASGASSQFNMECRT